MVLIVVIHNPQVTLRQWKVSQRQAVAKRIPSALASSQGIPPGGSLSYAAEAVISAFMDPTGSHTLLTTSCVSGASSSSSFPASRSIRHLYVPTSSFSSNPSDTSGVVVLTKWEKQLDVGGAKSFSRKGAAASAGKVHFPQHVTSVAWDTQYGTEGGAKRILLGTGRYGRVYEASILDSSSASGDASVGVDSRSQLGGGGSESSNTDDYIALVGSLSTGDDPAEFGDFNAEEAGDGTRFAPSTPFSPNSAPSPPARVCSIYFTRMSNSIVMVLATTSGKGRRTRFHTHTSAGAGSKAAAQDQPQHQTALGGAFSPTNAHTSFVELPGSVDGTMMKMVGDDFAFVSEFGIYHGTIDRGSMDTLAGGGSSAGGVKDSSMLMYDEIQINTIPVGFGLTRYHFIILEASGTVSFVSRISNEVVQRETILELQPPRSHVSSLHPVNPELICDARRPGEF